MHSNAAATLKGSWEFPLGLGPVETGLDAGQPDQDGRNRAAQHADYKNHVLNNGRRCGYGQTKRSAQNCFTKGQKDHDTESQ